MRDFLKPLGLTSDQSGASDGAFFDPSGEWLDCISPTDGERIARVRQGNVQDYERVMAQAQAVAGKWRMFPAPKTR